MAVSVLHGDCRTVLATLPAASVHCIVTSPPYYGLRDYGTAQWEGGEPTCQHSVGSQVADSKWTGAICTGVRPGVDASSCRTCGARRIDSQIGLEPTPDAYVAEMVAVFREARRVLRDDGTAWINLGDSYSTGGAKQTGRNDAGRNFTGGGGNKLGSGNPGKQGAVSLAYGAKPKDLLMIPARVALALQADGWYLRSEIIWSKPNPMPESVRDRPTSAHEKVFLFAKSPRYFYDADAVREEAKYGRRSNFRGGGAYLNQGTAPSNDRKTGQSSTTSGSDPSAGRNLRNVWTITPKPLKLAHFAVFPPALAETCIKAGCPAGGTVLDPFGGSGTTGLVADALGRNAVLIELNPAYGAMAEQRLAAAPPTQHRLELAS